MHTTHYATSPARPPSVCSEALRRPSEDSDDDVTRWMEREERKRAKEVFCLSLKSSRCSSYSHQNYVGTSVFFTRITQFGGALKYPRCFNVEPVAPQWLHVIKFPCKYTCTWLLLHWFLFLFEPHIDCRICSILFSPTHSVCQSLGIKPRVSFDGVCLFVNAFHGRCAVFSSCFFRFVLINNKPVSIKHSICVLFVN